MYWESPYRDERNIKEAALYKITESDITDFITVNGKLIELDRRELYPAQPSKVISIFARQGQEVSKGDIIMEFQTESAERAASAFYSEAASFMEKGNFSALKSSVGENDIAEEGERYYLISPISGIIMDIYCSEGEFLSGMLPCAAVSDMSELGVSARVGEINIAKIKTDMKCEVKVDTFSDKTFDGKIINIEPYASASSILSEDKETKTTLIAKIKGDPHELRPGYSAALKIMLGTYRNRLIVPYNCIDQDDSGEYVMKIGQGMKLQKVNISTSRELETGIEVVSGLSAGDIVVEDPEKYAEGERVRAICE